MPVIFWSVAVSISQWREEIAQINLNDIFTEDDAH